MIAVSARDGTVDVFRASDGALVVHPLNEAPGQATYLAWFGTAVADTGLYAVGDDPHILSLDLHAGPRLVTTAGSPIAEPEGIFLLVHTSWRSGRQLAHPTARFFRFE